MRACLPVRRWFRPCSFFERLRVCACVPSRRMTSRVLFLLPVEFGQVAATDEFVAVRRKSNNIIDGFGTDRRMR